MAERPQDNSIDRNERLREPLVRLLHAVHPVLAAYRSTSAEITREQITAAWTAYDDARRALAGD